MHLGHCGPSLLLSSTGNQSTSLAPDGLPEQCVGDASLADRCLQRFNPRWWDSYRLLGWHPIHLSPSLAWTVLSPSPSRRAIHASRSLLNLMSIFVCISSKASHIEIISDLTTEAFLAGLKHFIARRGLPQEIHSDNGSNFLCAKNDLNDLYHFLQSTTTTSAVNKNLLSQRVQWRCIPKRASHFGGLWEVVVKAAKYHLRHVMGTQRLTYVEFATVTCQIESCLNSQPLTPITSHAIDGISALTPGHSWLGDHWRPTQRAPFSRNHLYSRDGHYFRQWCTFFGRGGQMSTCNNCRPFQSGELSHQTYNHSPSSSPRNRRHQGRHDLDLPLAIGSNYRDFSWSRWPVRVVALKTATTTLKRPVAKLALIHHEENSSHDSPNSKTVVLPGEDIQEQMPSHGADQTWKDCLQRSSHCCCPTSLLCCSRNCNICTLITLHPINLN